MRFVALLLIGVFSVHAKLEDFDGLEELMNDPNLLSELEKRLGDILAEDRVDSDKNDELPCNATNGTLKAEQSSCGFDTQTGLIIKTSDSLRQKATFVGKTENVQCARDCAMQCCNNTKCDTAVYQNKESHKCYLFQCSLPGLGNVCVFDPHSNYSVSYMRSRSFNSLPGADHVSHENDLESLGSHLLRPEPVETVTPTTVGPLQTTTVQPGLGDTCSRYGPKCLDPHAECFMRECSCRAGYHNKYGICQHLCGKEEFECVNQGLSPRAKQCIHESLLCDGNRDCDDGSDEFITNCPKIDEGYKGFPDTNIYQKQLFPYPYNNYGYQALANQQSAPVPANHIYQNQVPANGQYYIPGLTSQNQALNIPQTGGSQLNKWPFMDNTGSGMPSSQNIDQSLYQNIAQPSNLNSAQIGQQQNIGLNQVPNVPLNQNPNSQVQQAPIQAPPPVNHNANQRVQSNNQGRIVDNSQPKPDHDGINVPAQPAKLVPENRPDTNKAVENPNSMDYHVGAQEKGQDQKAMNHPSSYLGKQFHILGDSDIEPDYIDNTDYDSRYDKPQPGNSRRRPDLYDTYRDQNKNPVSITDADVMSSKKGLQNGGGDYDESNKDRFRQDFDRNGNRHSAEDINDVRGGRTYPPSTKSRSQVVKPTQSTIAGQKSGHGSAYASERIEDFPIWMQYDGNSQNINAKKGKTVGGKTMPDESNMKAGKAIITKPTPAPNQRPAVTHVDKAIADNTKAISNDQSNSRKYKYKNYDDLEETGRFPTHDYPSKTRDRRPGYDASSYRDGYRNRYHRPSQGSRYPYYDNTGYRGHDRVHYPVWDSYREEYYYPDTYETRKGGSGHGLDYEDYGTDNQPRLNTDKQASNYKPKGPVESADVDHADKVSPVQPPKQIQDTGAQAGSQNSPDSHPAPGPQQPEEPQSEPDDITALAPSLNDQDNTKTEKQQPDEDSKKSNNSDSRETEKNGFTFFSQGASEKVESYTDGSQGPIVALALGLAITLILLIFVGCRLRTVKRRLRKGRALHSNEADYLINGMYL